MAGKFASQEENYPKNTTYRSKKRSRSSRKERNLLISIVCVALAVAVVLLLILIMGRGDVYHKPGEAVHTTLFDFTVDQAQVVDSYPGVESMAGYKLVQMRLSVTNTSSESYVMFSTDFQIQWNDDEFGTCIPPVDSKMVPFFYMLEPGQTNEGLMLIQVPDNVKTLTVVHQEQLESGAAGESYFVRLSL